VSRLNYQASVATLRQMLTNDSSADVRIASLNALHEINADGMTAITETALNDTAESVRMAGLSTIPDLDLSEEKQVEMLASVFDAGSVAEQQYALASLGSMKNAGAHEVLNELLGKLETGMLDPGIKLDLSTAVGRSGSADLMKKLQAFRATQPSDDPLTKYGDALEGGNAERGQRIFYRHAAAQCARCHNAGRGGGDIGPNLSEIGTERTREDLLISLVDPSAEIREGYGLTTLTFADGTTVTGTVTEEDDQFLEIISGVSEPVKMAKEVIKQRVDAPSSMPAMGDILGRKDLRDLVEFLSGLK
ncbi:MAG: hypothetical protein AB8G77_19675, partial [Rhodothermales bacterium]